MILGLDTSTELCAVGLADQGRLVSDYRFNAKYRHAEKLPLCIEHLLGDAGIEYEQIQGIAVSIGPGSFTGLRIGLSYAKGLAFGWEKPLLAVPTMEGLLARVPLGHDCVCVLSPARKREYYRGLFTRESEGWQEIEAVKIVKESDLDQALPERPFLFLGEGVLLIREHLALIAAHGSFLPDEFNMPSGYAIAVLGEMRLEKHDIAELETLSPAYMQRFQGVE